MRNRVILSGLTIASAATLASTGWAFTITPTFSSNSANLTPPVVWDANSMAVANTAINDWTNLLSYSDPNQNINMTFLFLPAGGNPFTTYLGQWQGSVVNPPAGTNEYPYLPMVSHTIKINSDLMNPRNTGANYPDYLTLAFNQAAPNPNPDPNSTQWDALTVLRKSIGQALGFTTLYQDSAGNLAAGNKWMDHVTVTGSTAVFDQTPGGLNIPLASSSLPGLVQFADSSDLMGQGALPTGTRIDIGFQDLEALSLAYGYAITVPAGRTFNTPTFKTQTITINGTVNVASTAASSGTPARALTSDNFTMASGGRLDISNHEMIIRGGSTLSQVEQLLLTGRGGTSGITSSAGSAAGLTLGVGTAGTLNLSTFDGDPVSPSDILIKATYVGDSNLDGKVDLTDLSTVLNHFGQASSHWTSGNFDGAATIDLTDLSGVLNNFGKTLPTTALQATGSLAMAAPEPGSLAALAAAGVMLLRRKRRA
ncbi:MAG: PEP-CTERM sorting domain-containing protein [Phycisphaerae bacterium]